MISLDQGALRFNMAHFAKIENNIVTEVIVISNTELLDENNEETEQKGIDFCKSLYGQDTEWVQTSYHGSIRSVFAGVGFTYDPINDVFIPDEVVNTYIDTIPN